ncbi:MAG: hypothetical protein ACRDSR_10375 [Pseudonocardiaceae bacterium]
MWITLRRAHEGGVASLPGCWLDSGRRVPDYVAAALDRLVSAGLLTLDEPDPESCGVRRVTVTDAGCARYVALCRVHRRHARVAVRTPHRWAHSARDQRSHLLAQHGADQIGVLIAVCGRQLPWSSDTGARPTGRACPTCEALPVWLVPAPRSGIGDPSISGRPLVPAPGGRPDTTDQPTSSAPVGAQRRATGEVHPELSTGCERNFIIVRPP